MGEIRAICLLSGGLDSMIGVCLLKDQGIHVEGLVFESPFFGAGKAKAAAEQLGVKLHILDFTKDIIELIKCPPHGFGSCMNPCVDCHTRMFKRAGELMTELGFNFISTGEVLNERPMSQNPAMLKVVARDSGYGDLLLRPLSALLLNPTKPEREGWVDRKRLLALNGRGRKPQIKLAQYYGFIDYPAPAGGCHLTDPNFSKRLRELREHEGVDDVDAIALLHWGRHYRLAGNVKLAVGRNERDNVYIEKNVKAGWTLLVVEGIPGPAGMLTGKASEEQIQLAATICASHTKAGAGAAVSVRVSDGTRNEVISVKAGESSSFRDRMI